MIPPAVHYQNPHFEYERLHPFGPAILLPPYYQKIQLEHEHPRPLQTAVLLPPHNHDMMPTIMHCQKNPP